jgi:ABC-type cobalt transport system substrate-binding protein
MKAQGPKFNAQSCGKLLLVFFFLLTAYCLPPTATFAAERWPGVDESVVEKYAKEQGREAHAPLINTSQGDLQLFVFLLAGAVGGFVAGYSWRKLMSEKTSANTKKEP